MASGHVGRGDIHRNVRRPVPPDNQFPAAPDGVPLPASLPVKAEYVVFPGDSARYQAGNDHQVLGTAQRQILALAIGDLGKSIRISSGPGRWGSQQGNGLS